MGDYEQHHYDKELLAQAAVCMGNIEVNPIWDLEQVRAQINKLSDDNSEAPKLMPDWCFVDCKFFNIFLSLFDYFHLPFWLKLNTRT